MTDIEEKDREEISSLLPWYANGTLDDDERRMVEKALQEDAGLAAEYELVLQDQQITQEALSSAEVPESMPLRFSSALERRLSQTHESHVTVAQEVGFLERISASLSGLLAGPRLAMVAAAAIFIVAVQGGALVSLMSGGLSPDTTFETANESNQPVDKNIVVLASFGPAVSMAEVTEFLTAQGAVIVGGPLPGGLYRLGFEPSDAVPDAATAIAKLKSKPELFVLALPES